MSREQELSYDRLANVRVVLRAELGRTTMRFREVEALRPGSVVTLDRLAGEPVEIYCRGHCIARGEVVIEEETFAVRIMDIVSRGQTEESHAKQASRRRK